MMLCPCSNSTDLLPLLNPWVCKQGETEAVFEQEAPAQHQKMKQYVISHSSPTVSPYAKTWIKAEGIKQFVPTL